MNEEITASAGSGQYFISLLLGTPPQPLLSSPTQLRPHLDPLLRLHPPQSPQPHLLSSPLCFFQPTIASTLPVTRPQTPQLSLHQPSTLQTPCLFNYSYADSLLPPLFSTETASFHSQTQTKPQYCHSGAGFGSRVPNSIRPRESWSRQRTHFVYLPIGSSFWEQVLLLSQGLHSLSTTHNSRVGGEPLSPSFYYIGIKSVSVNGANYGFTLPFGPLTTTVTADTEQAHREVVTAIRRRVRELTVPSPTPGLSCAFKLVGNSVFSPPPRNYFIETENESCAWRFNRELGDWFSVIGNLMQQGFLLSLIETDLVSGFAYGCDVP
ncbi:hypothetical protein CFP56_026021 [Quercus suber]|uniref:Uncharacterized protein n=1 Tax=Quercus suber TaxID=58331 RepID=A0AAW0K2D2_QUESU